MPIQQLLPEHYLGIARTYLEATGRTIDDEGGAALIREAHAFREAHANLTIDAPRGTATFAHVDFLAHLFGDNHMITVPDGSRNLPALKIVDGVPALPTFEHVHKAVVNATVGNALHLQEFIKIVLGGDPAKMTVEQALEAVRARLATLEHLDAHNHQI